MNACTVSLTPIGRSSKILEAAKTEKIYSFEGKHYEEVNE